MIRRRTQTASYWQQEFELTAEDLADLANLLLDRGEPASTEVLVQALMDRRCRQEEKKIRTELSSGRVYQPKDVYQVGERLIFPALDLAVGTVVGTRLGSNPDYGAFTVVQVQMPEETRPREFASALVGDHALNRPEGEDDLLRGEELRTVAELYAAYGAQVAQKLVAALRQHEEFGLFRDQWFLRSLLAPVTTGQLNIAEAVIEVRGMPLPAAEFLAELDLPAEVPETIRVLSLNHALEGDPRFDNVGDSGRDVWYLRRLVPMPVLDPPERLAVVPEPYDPADVAAELRAMEREIDDEGSEAGSTAPSRTVYKATIRLIYPHWRCGTLPLTARTRGLFPQPTRDHSPVVLVDGQSGDRLQGWVVQAGSFVYGLQALYARHGLPVGATLKLERTRDPRVILVDIVPQRLMRLWVKVATVQDGRLIFQMRKLPVACEYDDLLAIGEDLTDRIDELWAQVQASGEGLFEVMVRILPELIKLSPQGTVHAKTIYSAVNVLLRVPPGAVFALLSTESCFVPMGGGYWTFDETLVPREAN